ncbi:hypothetical protein KC669_00755 [Candidatus Dojkabacteria bacterium]|uniref:Uncharacterized protein n=1 Tax=Candidatus Dojkabacteria bacterium TaxID=2099670 RepID=A0A955LAS4_9BACT|nr:hypothetical protein [Candidatus Dojkabacteria bacterium]
MNKIMKYRQSFYIIFTVFVMALALPVLLINSLFYYSDYNTSLVVNLKVNNEENSIPESLINEFSSESNVTKIDFQTNSITRCKKFYRKYNRRSRCNRLFTFLGESNN